METSHKIQDSTGKIEGDDNHKKPQSRITFCQAVQSFKLCIAEDFGNVSGLIIHFLFPLLLPVLFGIRVVQDTAYESLLMPWLLIVLGLAIGLKFRDGIVLFRKAWQQCTIPPVLD